MQLLMARPTDVWPHKDTSSCGPPRPIRTRFAEVCFGEVYHLVLTWNSKIPTCRDSAVCWPSLERWILFCPCNAIPKETVAIYCRILYASSFQWTRGYLLIILSIKYFSPTGKTHGVRFSRLGADLRVDQKSIRELLESTATVKTNKVTVALPKWFQTVCH